MNSDERRSSTRIRFVRSSASARAGRMVDRGVEERLTNAIIKAAAMPLPVTSAITTLRAAAATKLEEVEEIAADFARGLVWAAMS